LLSSRFPSSLACVFFSPSLALLSSLLETDWISQTAQRCREASPYRLPVRLREGAPPSRSRRASRFDHQSVFLSSHLTHLPILTHSAPSSSLAQRESALSSPPSSDSPTLPLRLHLHLRLSSPPLLSHHRRLDCRRFLSPLPLSLSPACVRPTPSLPLSVFEGSSFRVFFVAVFPSQVQCQKAVSLHCHRSRRCREAGRIR
jgi:hypothetical protein